MADEADWYVLTTAPQREIAVAADMRRMGLLAVVPVERRVRRSKGRHNKPLLIPFQLPLFPGYVFIGSKAGVPWADVGATKHVRGALSFSADQSPARLSDADVDAIRRLATNPPVTGGTLKVGDAARVRRGPFRDLEGIILSIRPDVVRVSLVLFGAPREVPVSVDNVERV